MAAGVASNTHQRTLDAVDALLKDCYGDWTAASGVFPKPMSELEAGPSPSGQRRYLWTDAFAILTFISQAILARQLSHESPHQPTDALSQKYLGAASRLIDSVHECLGQPRSPRFPMQPDVEEGGYKGLRIGKVFAVAEGSDYGMTYDGMYWHYEDKHLLALSRYALHTSDSTRLQKAISLIKQMHPFFFAPGKGYHWKLNSDLSVIRGAPDPRPSHDVLSAYVVYGIIDAQSGTNALKTELDELQPLVSEYLSQAPQKFASEITDPLGLGTHLLTSQFLAPSGKVDRYKASLLANARPVLNSAIASSRVGDPLNFRTYGALLGCQVSGDGELEAFANRAAWELLKGELASKCGESEHSTINKVMLAAAINPLAWKKLPEEGLVVVP